MITLATIESIEEAIKYLVRMRKTAADTTKEIQTAMAIRINLDDDLESEGLPAKRMSNITIPKVNISSRDFTALKSKFDKYLSMAVKYKEVRVRTVEWRQLWSKDPMLSKLLKEADATLKVLQTELATQKKWLSTNAEKLSPVAFNKLTDAIFDPALEVLDAETYSVSTISYVQGDVLNIAKTLKLENLTSNNIVKPEYFVVVTLSCSNPYSVHLTTHEEYETPGTYDIGEVVNSSEEGVAVLTTLLALDDMDVHISNTPFPVSEKNVTDLDARVRREFDTGEARMIKSIGLNPNGTQLELRTTKYLTPTGDVLKDILVTINSNLPTSLQRGKLRMDSFAECTVTVVPSKVQKKALKGLVPITELADWYFVEQPDGSFTCNVRSDNSAGAKKKARQCIEDVHAYAIEGDGKVSTGEVHNLVTYFLRSDHKNPQAVHLREFVTNLKSSNLTPGQIKSIRTALGV